MPLATDCPHCHKEFVLPDALFGRRIKCKSCGGVFRVGGASAPPTHEDFDSTDAVGQTQVDQPALEGDNGPALLRPGAEDDFATQLPPTRGHDDFATALPPTRGHDDFATQLPPTRGGDDFATNVPPTYQDFSQTYAGDVPDSQIDGGETWDGADANKYFGDTGSGDTHVDDDLSGDTHVDGIDDTDFGGAPTSGDTALDMPIGDTARDMAAPEVVDELVEDIPDEIPAEDAADEPAGKGKLPGKGPGKFPGKAKLPGKGALPKGTSKIDKTPGKGALPAKGLPSDKGRKATTVSKAPTDKKEKKKGGGLLVKLLVLFLLLDLGVVAALLYVPQVRDAVGLTGNEFINNLAKNVGGHVDGPAAPQPPANDGTTPESQNPQPEPDKPDPDQPNPEPDKPDPDQPNPEPDKPDPQPEPEPPTPEPEPPTPEPEPPTPEPEPPMPEPEPPTPEPEPPTPEPEPPTPEPEPPTPEPEPPTPEPEPPMPEPEPPTPEPEPPTPEPEPPTPEPEPPMPEPEPPTPEPEPPTPEPEPPTPEPEPPTPEPEPPTPEPEPPTPEPEPPTPEPEPPMPEPEPEPEPEPRPEPPTPEPEPYVPQPLPEPKNPKTNPGDTTLNSDPTKFDRKAPPPVKGGRATGYFAENFDNPFFKWDWLPSGTRYVNGGPDQPGAIEVSAGKQFHLDGQVQDGVIRATIWRDMTAADREVRGDKAKMWEIQFRFVDPTNYHVLQIRADGNYRILRMNGGRQTTLVGDSRGDFTALPGWDHQSEYDEVVLEFKGANVKGSYNGKLLAESNGAGSSAGKVGIRSANGLKLQVEKLSIDRPEQQ